MITEGDIHIPKSYGINDEKESLYSLWRQDDNGNSYRIESGLSKKDAERLCQEMESKAHKQVYWIESDTDEHS